MLHKVSHWSHKLHASGFLLAFPWSRLIYQHLSRSYVIEAHICLSTVSEVLMVVDHPIQACEATASEGKSCIQQQLELLSLMDHI